MPKAKAKTDKPSKKLTGLLKQSKKSLSSTFGIDGKGDFSKTIDRTNKKPVSDFEELRQFDLTWQYGPCTGITRLERWERAARHGLSPPDLIKRLVLQHKDDKFYTECLWNNHQL